jgi:hypothetical protein
MTTYEIIKHNDNLFAVMSVVQSKGWGGQPRTFKNFVAEATTLAEAQRIAANLGE